MDAGSALLFGLRPWLGDLPDGEAVGPREAAADVPPVVAERPVGAALFESELRAAAIPIVTGAGLVLTFLVGGTIIVEPGIGATTHEMGILGDLILTSGSKLSFRPSITVRSPIPLIVCSPSGNGPRGSGRNTQCNSSRKRVSSSSTMRLIATALP